MAVINAQGQIIKELEPDDPFLKMRQRLSELKYPDDAQIIKHLPSDIFRYWVYGLHPKEALFLTNDRVFRTIQDRMRNKGWFLELADALWRVFHGIDFSFR